MLRRERHRLTFLLERFLQRGARYQVLVIALIIALTTLLGGTVAYAFSDAFSSFGEAVWWAFLRLTDPGYLGDDEGALLRTVSATLTVLGFVLFVGSLVAVLTQGLHAVMRRLEQGRTPIAIENHILVLGWTNRTPALVQEIVQSEERVRRFLRQRGTRRLRIVILVEHLSGEHTAALRARLGARWDERQVILRTGSSLHRDHLERVDYGRAGVIILPGADVAGGGESSDAHVVKTLLSIAGYRHAPTEVSRPPRLPPVVAEMDDAHKVPLAEAAYPGDTDLLAGDELVSHLLAQILQSPGLGAVLDELLARGDGQTLFVRELPALNGAPFGTLAGRFDAAVPVGLVRPSGTGFTALLLPDPAERVAPGDRLVLLAGSYEAAGAAGGAAAAAVPEGRAPLLPPAARRVLVLGWSQKAPALLAALAHSATAFTADLLSVVPLAERERVLRRYGAPAAPGRQLVGDYTSAADLQGLDLHHYDHLLLLGSDWLASSEAADARTVLGYTLLRTLRADANAPPLLVELLDPDNRHLFTGRDVEVVVSPLVLSRILAHMALRRELSAVYRTLFQQGGPTFRFIPAAACGLEGAVSFRAVQRAAAACGLLALGLRLHVEGTPAIVLNPPRHRAWPLSPADEIIVLAPPVRSSTIVDDAGALPAPP